MKFLLYIIKFINTTVVLIGITASLHAQSSDCLNKSCSKTSKNGEIEVEFGYQLKIADDVNGKISFKNGQYIIDTKEKSKVKILNVEVTNDTSGLMVFFDKKWLPPNSLFTYGTKDFTKGKDNGDLRLKLNNIQSPSDFILRFGIGESRSSIPTYTDSITFSFRIEGEEKAIKTENPVAPPIKENTTKTKEIITKKEEELEAPKRNDIDTTNSIAVTTPKPRQKPKEAIKKTPEPPKPSPTLKAPPVEESPTKSEKKPKETRAQRKRRKEKEAWENALKENTITTYRKFEEDYPKSKNIKESKARRRHIRSESPKKTENGYSIILKNVFDPVVVEPVPNATIEFNKIDKRPYHRELIVSNIENQKNIEIHIKDKEKPKSFKPFPIRLGKHLEVPANAVVISQDTQRIEKIIFKNGKPPYKITFFSEKKTPKPIPIDRTDYKVESGDTIFEWTPIDNFFKDNELYDTITFTLSDSELNMPYSHDNWILPRPEEKTDTTLYWVLVAGLGLLLLCALYVAYKVVGKKRNREKYNKKRKEKSESFKKENEHKKETILNNKIDVEEGGNEYVFENQQALLPNTNPNIKIKSIRKASRAIEYEDERKLEKILATEVSFSLPMSSFWQDSSISEIYFKKKLCRDIR